MSSFGEDLKREREVRKISLREIAESTKINARYLDALEKNDFKRLPGGVFNKGFVRAYAQHIGVDDEAMVNAYLLEEQAQGDDSPASEGEALRGNYGDRFTGISESDAAFETSRNRKRYLLALCIVAIVIATLTAGWMLWSKYKPSGAEGVEPAITAPLETERTASEPPVPAAEPEAEIPTIEAEPPALPPASETVQATEAGPLEVEITLARPTNGRLNCDNRQVEMLDRLGAGVTLGFRCERFLLIDAEDGGALLIARSGGNKVPLAEDGVTLRQHRLTPESEAD